MSAISHTLDGAVASLCTSGDVAGIARLAATSDFAVDARDSAGRTPLLLAARAGHLPIVQILLDRGADVDAVDRSGYSALTLAVSGDHTGVVRALLARGANPSPEKELPLIAAARRGQREIVELLVAGGAPIEARDHLGRGPLYWAAYFGHRDVVDDLLDRGADLQVRDDEGNTPLHGAASNVTDPEVIRELIARGARVDTVNRGGATPIDLAEREGERDLMAAMKRWAAG